jgi:vancomycin resistance protein YoaR
VAAAAIDGQVLMPGETFSFNQSTGERTWDKGYRMAHIFERKPGQLKAEVVDGLAGGVCQVSTTLYNAVRKSREAGVKGLRIVERNFHSLPVTYVSPGYDATVAWPIKDFRFRNTLQHPIYLRAAVSGSRLNVSVWGRVPNNGQAVTVPALDNGDETKTNS